MDAITYSTGPQGVTSNLSVELSDELEFTMGGHEISEDELYALAWQYCFVCSRSTDHVGDHDDLVEAGKAYYDGCDVKIHGRTSAGNLLTQADVALIFAGL